MQAHEGLGRQTQLLLMIFLIFSNQCLVKDQGRGRQVKYRGEDYTAELQLELTDAYKTHHQTLNVNDKKIRITVPAGIEHGQTIRIPGHGGKGINGGPDGDLYITFSISNNTIIQTTWQ